MQSSQILDGNLYIRLSLSHSDIHNNAFRNSSKARGYLASQLLNYDTIIVPTMDFGIVPILIDWFGIDNFRSALETDAIRFAKIQSIMVYGGPKGGLGGMVIQENPPHLMFDWWQNAMFGPYEDAPELQIKHKNPSIGSKERKVIVDQILKKSKAALWENEQFMRAVVDESYLDIVNNESLSDQIFGPGNQDRSPERLTKLPGWNPDEARVSVPDSASRDGIDLTLKIAEVNQEILMAKVYGGCDVGTTSGAEQLLVRKLWWAGVSPSVAEQFFGLIELRDLPDIRGAVESGEVGFSDIMALRNKAVSRKFRKWLRTVEAKDAQELERMYIKSLESEGFGDRLPVRLFRFAATASAGVIHPVLGPAAGLVDSFLVEQWLKGYSPKFFFGELRKLIGQQSD